MNVQCNAQCSRARETSNAKSPSVNEMHKPLAEVLDAVTNGLPSPWVPREQLTNPHRDVKVALGEAHLKVRRIKSTLSLKRSAQSLSSMAIRM